MVVILVLLTIFIVVAIDAALVRRRSHERALQPLAPRPFAAQLPAGLFVHPGHGWVQVHTDGTVDIGVDAFVRSLVGPPDRVMTTPVGTDLIQGTAMLQLEQGGRRLSVPAPLSGRIEAVNTQVTDRPEDWVETGARGWTYTIRPARLGAEISRLRIGEQAARWLQGQGRDLAAWLADIAVMPGSPAPTLPDGGEPACGALRHLGPEAWAQFERQFLTLPGVDDAAADAGANP